MPPSLSGRAPRTGRAPHRAGMVRHTADQPHDGDRRGADPRSPTASTRPPGSRRPLVRAAGMSDATGRHGERSEMAATAPPRKASDDIAISSAPRGRHRGGRQAAAHSRARAPPWPRHLGAAAVVTTAFAAPADASPHHTVWDQVANCESGRQLAHRHRQRLLRRPAVLAGTWRAYGGHKYAAQADDATRMEQIQVARRVLDSQGPGAWPVCGPSAGLTGRTVTPPRTPLPQGRRRSRRDEDERTSTSAQPSTRPSTTHASATRTDLHRALGRHAELDRAQAPRARRLAQALPGQPVAHVEPEQAARRAEAGPAVNRRCSSTCRPGPRTRSGPVFVRARRPPSGRRGVSRGPRRSVASTLGRDVVVARSR